MTALALATCPACGSTFEPRPRQTCCSEPCRWRFKDQRRRTDPRRVAYVRSYYATHLRPANVDPSPWHYGAPPFAATLPGGSCPLSVSPPPISAIEHRHARHLHGVICHLLGRDHDQAPAFALRPSAEGCGWSVRWAGAAGAELAGRTFTVRLLGGTRRLDVGPIQLEPAPSPFQPRGRRRVRVDAVTPVVIRSMGGTTVRTAPEASHVRSALLGLAARLRLPLRPDDLMVELVERGTMPEAVPLGGKYPRLRGWIGHLVLEANAPARWLLLVAERVGLGGRTAFGFGCVRVTEIPR